MGAGTDLPPLWGSEVTRKQLLKISLSQVSALQASGTVTNYCLSLSTGETPELSKLKKALSSIANIHPSASLPPGPISPTAPLPTAPALRVQRPTVRIPHKKPPLNSAGSSENLLSGGPQSPLHRPSSRSGIRPPSRSGGLLKKKSSDLLLPGRGGSGMRLSRSHQPSPAHR